MKEYEYSFKVKDIKPYIDYCEDNGYNFLYKNEQVRELYRNPNKTLARITRKIVDGHEENVLDFKDEEQSYEVLKVARETIPLKIEKYNKEAVHSILEMLGYKKHKILNRTRVVYQKDDVKFELDSYTSPEKMFIVGIEGNDKKVDLVYQEVIEKIGNVIK